MWVIMKVRQMSHSCGNWNELLCEHFCCHLFPGTTMEMSFVRSWFFVLCGTCSRAWAPGWCSWCALTYQDEFVSHDKPSEIKTHFKQVMKHLQEPKRKSVTFNSDSQTTKTENLHGNLQSDPPSLITPGLKTPRWWRGKLSTNGWRHRWRE